MPLNKLMVWEGRKKSVTNIRNEKNFQEKKNKKYFRF